MYCWIKYFFLIFSLSIITIVGSAQSLFKLDRQKLYYNLGKSVEILEDKSKKLSLKQVRSAQYQALFKKSQQNIPNFGYTDAHYWFRIKIQGDSNIRQNWYFHISNHFIDTLTVYQFIDKQLVRTRQTGDLFPFQQRYVDYRGFLIPLELETGQTQEIYIQFKGFFSKRLPIEVVEIASFLIQSQYYLLFIAIISGIFIALIIYNTFLYLGIRDLGYLYYVLYMSCFLLVHWTYNGLAFQLFLNDFPAFASIAFNFFVCISLVFSNCFADSFLKIKLYYPSIQRLILLLNIGLLSTAVLFLYCIFDTHYVLIFNQIGVFFGLPSIIVVYVLSFWIFFAKGFKPAQYYIYAWGFVYLSFIIFLLKTLNIISSNFVTESGFQMASAIEALLLSLGLANRINQERKEKLHLARENEKIVREQNTILEEKVKERTHEINEMNYELQQMNEELMQINETLHTQKLNLEELNQEKDGLMSILVHDLRTPLGKIHGLNHLVQTVSDLNEEQKEYTQLIEDICNQSVELINDILTLNVITQENYRQIEELDLEKLVLNQLRNFQSVASSKKISINFQNIDNQSIIIHSAKNFLHRILDNLISNALKFSYPNSTVEIKIGKNAQYVFIEIQDQGQGIKLEEQGRLFRKFQKLSAKPTANESSTGLGLTIVKTLVDNLRGRIEVKSEWGKGANFIVFLPFDTI